MNLIVGAYGLICLSIFVAAVVHSNVLSPGEDAVEPLALLVVPIAFNVCYTLGWIVEVPVRVIWPSLSWKAGTLLMLLGLVFSFCVLSLPAIFWVGYIALQAVGIVKS